MTGCKIGKIRMKNGAEIVPIRNTNLTLHTSGMHWTALKEANNLVHEGRASMVAVAVIYDNGDKVYTNFSKRQEMGSLEVLGAVQLLNDGQDHDRR